MIKMNLMIKNYLN
jgi:hypothetical protein